MIDQRGTFTTVSYSHMQVMEALSKIQAGERFEVVRFVSLTEAARA
jgi:hypothetical protein